jgi:hypothetical protein
MTRRLFERAGLAQQDERGPSVAVGIETGTDGDDRTSLCTGTPRPNKKLESSNPFQ